MDTYGADDRKLFETRARRCTRSSPRGRRAHRRRPPASSPAASCTTPSAAAGHGPGPPGPAEGNLWSPRTPTCVQSRVVSPLSQQGAQLLEESSRWARAFGVAEPGLAQGSRRLGARAVHATCTARRSTAFLAGLVAEAEEEMLTAQPQTGRDIQPAPPGALRDTAAPRARRQDPHALPAQRAPQRDHPQVRRRRHRPGRRGPHARRVLQPDDRRRPPDRGHPGRRTTSSVALAVREPSVVAYLVDVFERSWERARPFTSRETSLIEGHRGASSGR